MDKTLTLPPLVRGNVTGFLDFFIDEIRIFRNILFLTESFDIVGQVQWWGEISPAYIRPRKLHLSENHRKKELIKTYLHSARYVIKTKLDLFKSYLRACEVLEVSVLEAVENYVIGSAFLKDLINLLNNRNELVMPIFNYAGEVIGEVKIHVNFSHCDKTAERLMKDNYLSLDDDTLSMKHETCHRGGGFRKSVRQNRVSTQLVNKKVTSQEKDLDNKINQTERSLPQIKTIGDSSKVLYFDLGLNNGLKTDKKHFEQPNKFNINSVKCKSRNKNTEKIGSKDNVGFQRNKITATQKSDSLKDSGKTAIKSQDLEARTNHTDVEGISLKESTNTKVLDYLLGSEMSREEEERALRDFKKMSPSHNFVTSINQLCLFSDPLKSQRCIERKEMSSSKVNRLAFDLSIPVERDYYERFFMKSNSCDFEVAEFLNQPENSCLMEKMKGNGKSYVKGDNAKSQSESQKSSNCGENNFVDGVSERIANSCARCKYYKKLDELDMIIESLKHFEKKILVQEKDAEGNSRSLTQRN